MERRALVLALALVLPLALFGIPYAYATVTSSDHGVQSTMTVHPQAESGSNVACPSGDYAVSGGYQPASFGSSSSTGFQFFPDIFSTFPTLGGTQIFTGQTPDGWGFEGVNDANVDATAIVWVVCQTPVTVAGIGVPQFGSLYVAIALGAVVYFMLSRRFARRPAIPTQALS